MQERSWNGGKIENPPYTPRLTGVAHVLRFDNAAHVGFTERPGGDRRVSVLALPFARGSRRLDVLPSVCVSFVRSPAL